MSGREKGDDDGCVYYNTTMTGGGALRGLAWLAFGPLGAYHILRSAAHYPCSFFHLYGQVGLPVKTGPV